MPRGLAAFLVVLGVVAALTALLAGLVEPAQAWLQDAPGLLRSVTRKLQALTSPTKS